MPQRRSKAAQGGVPPSRASLLDATLNVVRRKGYSAARVEDICEAAGVTKGSFFHHFDSKDDLANAAAGRWSAYADQVFRDAPYQALPDPVDRLLAYVDFRIAMLKGKLPDFTCFAGTMIQEIYLSHPELRDACARTLVEHAATLEPTVEAALRDHPLPPGLTARSIVQHMQAVIQGAYILAKAHDSAGVAADSLRHLRRYLQLLFGRAPTEAKP